MSAGSTSCMNLTKGSEAAVDALQATMSVEGSRLLALYPRDMEGFLHPFMVNISVYVKSTFLISSDFNSIFDGIFVLAEDTSRFRSFLMDFSYPRTQSSARDVWPTARSGDLMAGGNQWQGSSNAPCSDAVVTHPYIHPTSHYTSELPPSECLAGVSDSSCALSLLSTQPWGTATAPRNRAPSNSTISGGLDGMRMGQELVVTSSCMAHPWGFKNHGACTTSHENQHATGLGHFDENGSGQFSGELELALQGNRHCPEHGPARVYDHSSNGMHWSL